MPSTINSTTTAGVAVSGDNSGVLALQTNNGTTAVTIDTSQRVGIGTASPSARLHVSTSAAGIAEPVWLNNSQAVGAGVGSRLVFTGTTSNNGLAAIDGAFAGATTADGGYMVFNTRAVTSGTLTERMRITSTGNVGIGTTTPTTQLEIKSAAFTDSEITLDNTSSNTTSRVLFKAAGTEYGRVSGDATQVTLQAGNIPMVFRTNSAERMRITSTGNVGIGTSSVNEKFEVSGTVVASGLNARITNTDTDASARAAIQFKTGASSNVWQTFAVNGALVTGVAGVADYMRINSSGDLLVGTTSVQPADDNINGIAMRVGAPTSISCMGSQPLIINRGTNDGVLINLYQDAASEGNISVSGSTVSYNGGHLSRWSQLPNGSKDESIVKGTVMSNLDDMCVWEKDCVVADNEQLNKMKVSDVEGDTNVAGVFVNWTIDADYGVDDMNVAMTGDMIIRIADGVVVQKGDLLMSAGDGTAKPQGDDIVRSKTIAKVTSNHVTCTYADGSYCVPCVLMAC